MQNWRMMSWASAEIGGSWGNTTGFSTILFSGGSASVSQKGAHVSRPDRRTKKENPLFVYLDWVLVPKWWVARQELVYQNAEGPPVDGRGVTLVMYDLGGQVLWRPAEGVRLDGAVAVTGAVADCCCWCCCLPQPSAQALREAKVDKADVPLLVEQQVLGLEVAVGDAALGLVQVLEHEHDLGGVEDGHALVEAAVLAQVAEELAAGHVVEHEVQEVAVREGGAQVRDEGVARHLGQDGALVAHVVDLLELDHFGLAQDLERKHLGPLGLGLWVGWPDEADARKCACFRCIP